MNAFIVWRQERTRPVYWDGSAWTYNKNAAYRFETRVAAEEIAKKVRGNTDTV